MPRKTEEDAVSVRSRLSVVFEVGICVCWGGAVGGGRLFLSNVAIDE